MEQKSTAWQKITGINTEIVRKTLSVKQSIAQSVDLPADTALIDLIEGSRVELADGSGMSFAVLHFVDANDNRFAFLASPLELEAVWNMCMAILKDMNRGAVSTPQ
ncbi:hypothetical protein [uncultured Parasutterella sp.]|uniref:hypothetical protein n=1 Tax=uncultured Parasutterella sp. TaxID=1263098 RepID=UPI0025981EBB|nr:hypothetical protein [uncultured Parasutterella sp.]